MVGDQNCPCDQRGSDDDGNVSAHPLTMRSHLRRFQLIARYSVRAGSWSMGSWGMAAGGAGNGAGPMTFGAAVPFMMTICELSATGNCPHGRRVGGQVDDPARFYLDIEGNARG